MTLASRISLAFIRLYQWCISPWLGARCRFEPTCSHYAAESVKAHGAWRGGLLATWRLLRCNPFGATGFDPVPPARRKS